MIVLAGAGLIAAACASAGSKSAPRPACALLDRDSAFAVGRPVYRDCGVDRVARLLTTDVRPDFRPTTPRSTCYSADLEFVVDSTGKPEVPTARLVHANDQDFGASVLATLGAWKYEPAVRDARPVRQIVEARKMMSTVLVAVPRGSSPPSGPPSQRPPSC